MIMLWTTYGNLLRQAIAVKRLRRASKALLTNRQGALCQKKSEKEEWNYSVF
jgi:hypothetical protein